MDINDQPGIEAVTVCAQNGEPVFPASADDCQIRTDLPLPDKHDRLLDLFEPCRLNVEGCDDIQYIFGSLFTFQLRNDLILVEVGDMEVLDINDGHLWPLAGLSLWPSV